jgi:maltose O-acetyltransferase
MRQPARRVPLRLPAAFIRVNSELRPRRSLGRRLSALTKRGRELKARLGGHTEDIARLVDHGLELGSYVFIGQWVVIDPDFCFLVSIADGAQIAPRVHILAHDASTKATLGVSRVGRVRIGRYAFVGAGSTILPGVTIGDGAIVGAGSVVSRDVAPGDLVAGSPAKRIGSAAEYLERHRGLLAIRPAYSRQWSVTGGISKERMEQMRMELDHTNGYVE